jgi:hypothetical protein
MAGPGFGTYFQSVATVYGGTTSATISGLLPNTSYRFQVVAQNAAGDSPPSNPAAGTTAKSESVASAIPSGVSTSTANLVIGWYQQFMARTPSPTEVFAWAQALDNGSITPAAAALAIATSVECDTYQVTQLYERYLNRAPDAEGLQGWVNLMQSGASLQAVAARILGSDEYNARVGGSAFAFVNSLYQNLLGRSALGSELSIWLNALAQSETRAQVAAGFLNSAEYAKEEVDQFYSQWLNRQPDPSGLAAWEAALANGISDEQAAASFGASAEFMSDQQQ